MRRAALLAVAGALLVGAAWAALAATRPDPDQQAIADGCRRDRTKIFTGEAANWVYVNDRDYPAGGPPPPPQWVTGIADAANRPDLATHPSGGDNPLTHLSYDFNVNVRPERPEEAYLLGGNATGTRGNFAGEGEEAGRLHTEREMGSLPPFAWADRGDRVRMLGSWVWDCDHIDTGERTEFHPVRAVWVQRNPQGAASGPSPRSPTGEAEGDLFVSSDATPAGIIAECAHRTKLSTAFKGCLQTAAAWVDVNGRYEFSLPAPPRPSPTARLLFRVVDRGSSSEPDVRVRPERSGVKVSFTIASPPGRRVVVAKQVFVGWSPMPERALPEHLRVTLERLLVRRAMDPSCPPHEPTCPAAAQTTRFGQISTPPGEWNLYWNVGGIWGLWRPVVLRARDGQSFPGRQTVDLYVARGKPWRLFALARECDFGALGSFRGQTVPVAPCPRGPELGHPAGDDYPGFLARRFPSPGRSVGLHTTNSELLGSTCPQANRSGCYALTYRVLRIDDARQRAARTRR